MKYDTKFIFAEVNSDKVYWKFNKEKNDYEPIRVDTDAVGESPRGIRFFKCRANFQVLSMHWLIFRFLPCRAAVSDFVDFIFARTMY